MLPSNSQSSEPKTLILIDECRHLASSSLNSIEYLTAATLGVARDCCKTTSSKSMELIQSATPWSAADIFSMTQTIFCSDCRKVITQIEEIVHDYFEYVGTNLGQAN